MKKVCMFFVHLEYITDSWYFFGHLVIYVVAMCAVYCPSFWYVK
jgi:hypothetical protein